jgi:hypothetical protein
MLNGQATEWDSVMEATEIELHRYNINREGDFHLSKSQKPLNGSLKLSGYDW